MTLGMGEHVGAWCGVDGGAGDLLHHANAHGRRLEELDCTSTYNVAAHSALATAPRMPRVPHERGMCAACCLAHARTHASVRMT